MKLFQRCEFLSWNLIEDNTEFISRDILYNRFCPKLDIFTDIIIIFRNIPHKNATKRHIK